MYVIVSTIKGDKYEKIAMILVVFLVISSLVLFSGCVNQNTETAQNVQTTQNNQQNTQVGNGLGNGAGKGRFVDSNEI